MPRSVLLSLGSNLGDRFETFLHALASLEQCRDVSIANVSSVYGCKALGYTQQPDFLNCCVLVQTAMELVELHSVLRAIETDVGRQHRQRWHERELDIDIIVSEFECVRLPHLVVPHPHMHERRFVLQPAAEIAAEMQHPLEGKSMIELLDECKDNSRLQLYPQSLRLEWLDRRDTWSAESYANEF